MEFKIKFIAILEFEWSNMQIANYTFVKTFQKGNGFTIRSSHNDTDPLLLLLMLQFRDIWIVCQKILTITL